MTEFAEVRIAGNESGFVLNGKRRRETVNVIELVLAFHLRRAEGPGGGGVENLDW